MTAVLDESGVPALIERRYSSYEMAPRMHLIMKGSAPAWAILATSCSAVLLLASRVPAQDSYEIQVYGSETVPRGQTMVESHSNYTFKGNKNEMNGVLPNYHSFHETIEVTHGFTPWFETGFYLFTSIQPG